MGKIKQKLVRRTADTLLKKNLDFKDDFENNKKLLGNSIPSKKIRNQIAGLIAKIKKKEKLDDIKFQQATKK